MRQFINAKDVIVTEALDGLIQSSAGRLTRLDGYPHIKVALRADWAGDKVALISGGGSGHEPAHAGLVGQGLLTAAVCGEVFASPSVDAVLAGIMAVTGEAGCVLIVKNYTGDRLNFGLAAERARALGRKVEMIVVADDVALPDLPQPRGVAGALFVHKIAGAAAEAGADLAEVAAIAARVAGAAKSFGLSVDTCTVPGAPKEGRIAEGQAELGLGIHGEPGVAQIDYAGATAAMAEVTSRLAPHVPDGPRALILNNLGGATPLEMSILSHALAATPLAKGAEALIGPAPLMTSLDMRGFSVSVLPLEQGDLEALTAPVAPPAWPQAAPLTTITPVAMPEGLAPTPATPSADPARRALIETACAALIAAERDLNALDAKTGDGDTGATLATAARALQGRLDALPLGELAPLLRGLGNELSQTMGGSSGVLLAIFFSAAGDAVAAGAHAAEGLAAGLDRIKEVGGAQEGDRTMIDALAPALEALPAGLSAAAAAARAGAEATARMQSAKAGRAAYVPSEALTGNTDPGAEAVARLFEALAN